MIGEIHREIYQRGHEILIAAMNYLISGQPRNGAVIGRPSDAGDLLAFDVLNAANHLAVAAYYGYEA